MIAFLRRRIIRNYLGTEIQNSYLIRFFRIISNNFADLFLLSIYVGNTYFNFPCTVYSIKLKLTLNWEREKLTSRTNQAFDYQKTLRTPINKNDQKLLLIFASNWFIQLSKLRQKIVIPWPMFSHILSFHKRLNFCQKLRTI